MSNSDKTTKQRPKRRRIPFLMRATFAGLAIALTSLWALTVSYDISREELLGFLVGSILLLLGVLLTAALLVSLIKILTWLISRLRKPATEDETQQD